MKIRLEKPKWMPVAGFATAALGVIIPMGVGTGVADPPDGQPVELAAEFDETTAEDITAMIGALSDESYETRKKATMELWQLGERALPDLRKAVDGADPEASDRASDLVLYISAGVLFDSSEEVKELVLKFSRGDVGVKRKILVELGDMGQWKQVLHLARMEEDAKVREQMSEDVRKIAIRAAREAVVDDDLELAGEIFQLSGDDSQMLAAKAWFFCQRGLLDQQLAAADAMPEKEGIRWRLALFRASGNLDGAIREAEKLGNDKLADGLKALAGNPLPWLKRSTDSLLQDRVLSRSCQIQMARLSGNENKAAIFARELRQIAEDDELVEPVVVSLAANGFREEALGLLEKYDALSAFDFYDGTESPERALAALGIPANAELPYTEWVRWFTSRAVDGELEDDYDQLLLLAGFLVRHGEGEHALAVVNPLMEALEDSGADIWFELVGKMPAYELGSQAIELILQRGNEDGEADLAVREMLGSSSQVTHLWTLLKTRNNQNLADALQQLALLAGLIPDPEGKTDALHQTLLDEVKDAPAAKKEKRSAALFHFAIRRHEIGKASEIVDELAPVHPKWQDTKLYLDTTLHRWEKVEPVYEAYEREQPGDYISLAKWSVVLRKMGREPKAKEVFERALLLNMGNIKTLHNIGAELDAAGYRQEAYSLILKSAMMSKPGSSDFDRSILYLANSGSLMAEQGGWKQAASVAEVYSRLTMRGRSGSAVRGILNVRFNADFYRGMYLLNQGDRAKGLKLLELCHQRNPGNGTLADEFFPALRKVDVGKSYDKWFEASYRHVLAACKKYPKAHNTQNTAAWLTSRAVRRLDDAMTHAKAAIALRPSQGAYLDTMAEVWFAKGDRKKAIEWSEKAVQASISHAQGAPRSEGRVLVGYRELGKQLERFKHGPLPTEGQ